MKRLKLICMQRIQQWFILAILKFKISSHLWHIISLLIFVLCPNIQIELERISRCLLLPFFAFVYFILFSYSRLKLCPFSSWHYRCVQYASNHILIPASESVVLLEIANRYMLLLWECIQIVIQLSLRLIVCRFKISYVPFLIVTYFFWMHL